MSFKYRLGRHSLGWLPNWAAPDNVILRILGAVLVVGTIALRPTQLVGSEVAESSSEMHSWSGFLTDHAGNTFAQSQNIPNSAYGNSVAPTGIDVTQLIRGDLAYQFSSERQVYFSDAGPSLFENKSQKYNGTFSDCNFDMDVREALGKNILCGSAGSKEFIASRLNAAETSEREVSLPAAVGVFGFALFGFVFLSNHRYS